MKLKLKHRNLIPYGGLFIVTDPLTKVEVKGTSFAMLLSRVVDQRKANGVHVGFGLEDEVESWCCQNHPDECEGWDGTTPKRRNLGLGDVIRGSMVMMKDVVAGRQRVTQAEAERRAAICAGCKWNMVFAKPCAGTCVELENVVNGVIKHQGTSKDASLHACNICGCFLQAAVWLPLETQCSGVTDEMKAQFKTVHETSGCWKQCE